MPATAFSPRIVYNAITLNLSLPLVPWGLTKRDHGGFGEAGSGVTASYLQRRDHLLTTTIRFTEDEYEAVLNWLDWAMENAGTSFVFRLNQLDAATEYDVFLVNPHIGEDVKPVRTPNYIGAWQLEITLRTSAGGRFITKIIT